MGAPVLSKYRFRIRTRNGSVVDLQIAPGEKIENQVKETYNNVDRESNIVWTSTPENPAIDVEKFTLSEGLPAGDRDDAKLAAERMERKLAPKLAQVL